VGEALECAMSAGLELSALSGKLEVRGLARQWQPHPQKLSAPGQALPLCRPPVGGSETPVPRWVLFVAHRWLPFSQHQLGSLVKLLGQEALYRGGNDSEKPKA
jgi:hypothetical protein